MKQQSHDEVSKIWGDAVKNSVFITVNTCQKRVKNTKEEPRDYMLLYYYEVMTVEIEFVLLKKVSELYSVSSMTQSYVFQ